MSTLPFIVIVAVAWHFGLAVFEHRRRPERDKPSMSRLFLLAEVEVLRTLGGTKAVAPAKGRGIKEGEAGAGGKQARGVEGD